MLKKIVVKNFAIIEDVEIEFKNGMTAITGQTGSGKSLFIDCLSLLLGARADNDMIRYGQDESIVIGYFINLSSSIVSLLNDFGINETHEVKIYRKISVNGKNVIKINEVSVTLQQLKQLGLLLGDIHSQFDTYRLINKDNYLFFLNDFSNKDFTNLYNNYQLLLNKYLESLNKYHKYLKKSHEMEEKSDLLEFQKKELEALDLKENIDIEIQTEIDELANYDKINRSLNEFYNYLNEEKALDNLYLASKSLEEIENLSDEYKRLYQTIVDAYYQVNDINSEIYEKISHLDFDEERLNELNSRLYSIEKIKAKYHMSVSELIKYYNEICLELSFINNHDELIKSLDANVKSDYKKLCDASLKLHNIRLKMAELVEKEIVSQCNDLDLAKMKFKIIFNSVSFNDSFDSSVFHEEGIDEVDFMVSFNTGEPLKSLSKVASGGELSRFMLSLKIFFLKIKHLDLMVFDEIDTGVSGITAYKIASKIKEISKRVQVLTITHLPQVAAMADFQLSISKAENDNRTITNFKYLAYDQRVKEIAMMLSGFELSNAVIEAAKKMLEK